MNSVILTTSIEILFSAWILCTMRVNAARRDPTERLKIVTRFERLEEFYLTVREYNRKFPKDLPETIPDRHAKGRICRSVLSTGFFVKSNLKPAKTDKLWDLKVSNSDFLKHLQKKEDLKYWRSFRFPNKPRILRMTHKKMDDLVDNAFLCIGLLHGVDYQAYYVSNEYNLDITSRRYIAGRFVFRNHRLDEPEMRVVFLAREPASVIEASRDKVEELYLEARLREKTAGTVQTVKTAKKRERQKTTEELEKVKGVDLVKTLEKTITEKIETEETTHMIMAKTEKKDQIVEAVVTIQGEKQTEEDEEKKTKEMITKEVEELEASEKKGKVVEVVGKMEGEQQTEKGEEKKTMEMITKEVEEVATERKDEIVEVVWTTEKSEEKEMKKMTEKMEELEATERKDALLEAVRAIKMEKHTEEDEKKETMEITEKVEEQEARERKDAIVEAVRTIETEEQTENNDEKETMKMTKKGEQLEATERKDALLEAVRAIKMEKHTEEDEKKETMEIAEKVEEQEASERKDAIVEVVRTIETEEQTENNDEKETMKMTKMGEQLEATERKDATLEAKETIEGEKHTEKDEEKETIEMMKEKVEELEATERKDEIIEVAKLRKDEEKTMEIITETVEELEETEEMDEFVDALETIEVESYMEKDEERETMETVTEKVEELEATERKDETVEKIRRIKIEENEHKGMTEKIPEKVEELEPTGDEDNKANTAEIEETDEPAQRKEEIEDVVETTVTKITEEKEIVLKENQNENLKRAETMKNVEMVEEKSNELDQTGTSQKTVADTYEAQIMDERTEEKDLICQLGRNYLIQICSSVMNSTYFDGVQEYSDDEAECVLKKVSFKNENEHLPSIAKEWMIWCPAEAVNKKFARTSYFVTRGNSPDTFFVCSGSSANEECILEHLCTNVAIAL